MKITISTEYATRALLAMAREPDQLFTVSQLTEQIDAPRKFLAKILQALAKKRFLRSQKGVTGGFMLQKSLDELTLLDIVEAVDGPITLNKCLMTGYVCEREHVCAAHDVWHDAQLRLRDALASRTLRDLVRDGELKALAA